MSLVRRLGSLSLVLGLALGLGACEETSQGPNEAAQLDPVAVTSALDVVNSTFATPQFKSLAALDGLAGVPGSDGLVLTRSGALVRNTLEMAGTGEMSAEAAREAQQMLALGRALYDASEGSGDFQRPSGLAGTYEWDSVQGTYVRAADTGAGLRADGECGEVSRIVLYALDSTGEPVVPLIEIAYLDMVYPCSGGIAMTLTGVDGVTYVHFLLAPNSTGLTLDGFVSDGNVVLTIDVDYVENESEACASYGDCAGSTYRFDALFSLNGPPLQLGAFYYFAFTEVGFDIVRGFKFDLDGQPIELVTTEYYEAIGPDTYWVTFYSQVLVGGNVFGAIDATGDEVLYLLPNGQPMSPEEIAAMQALLEEPQQLLSGIGEMLEPVVSLLGPLAGDVIPPILLP